MFKFICLFLSLFIFIGCASTQLSDRAKKVNLAKEEDMKSCKYLGNVKGSSWIGGLIRENGMQNARNEAIQNASNLNATDIVLPDESPSFFFGQRISGKAYKCK
jgi:hypothetical protein